MPRKKKETTPAPDQTPDNGAGQAAQPPDKAAAVREALAAGMASRPDILAFVRQKYGMEISPNYVSVVTSKARAKAKRTTATQPAAKEPMQNGGWADAGGPGRAGRA